MKTAKRKLDKKGLAIAFVLIGIGVALLLVNFAGFVTPLRNPNIFNKLDVLIEKQFYEAIVWEGETTAEYAVKVNDAVNNGIVQYWDDVGITKYNLRVPVQENWLLYCFWPGKYEFFDYRRAVERGVGLCSQESIIVSGIMQEHDINSWAVGMERHTVVMVQVDEVNNTWWVLDPSYGVVIEYSISEIARNPEIIAPYYSQKGYSDDVVRNLETIYREDPYSLYVGRIWLYLENFYYSMKWVVPLILAVVPSFVLYRNRKRNG